MRRDRQKKGRGAALNLVSLMDIFTILVFFLMVNSSEVEVLQTSSKIKLPDSSSEQKPENQLVVMVDSEDLVVQGRAVAKVAELAASQQMIIEGLQAELHYQAGRKGEMPEGGYEITVMGDREVPYWLLKRILSTCQATDFAKVSLAVNKISAPDMGTGERVPAGGDVAAAGAEAEGAAS